MKSEKGFTAIDVSIAIILIFIFVSILAVLFFQYNNSSQELERKSQATYYAISEIEKIKNSNFEEYLGMGNANIDIVEEVTGKNWDSNDWEIGIDEWMSITEKVNGTDKDKELLQGKTRADVPPNRQALMRFLEEKGWLFEQFR